MTLGGARTLRAQPWAIERRWMRWQRWDNGPVEREIAREDADAEAWAKVVESIERKGRIALERGRRI